MKGVIYMDGYISIHALLAESDFLFYNNQCQGKRFLSTLSLRRATQEIRNALAGASISIHALLAESDRAQDILTALNNIFLSTLSLRRATAAFRQAVPPKLYFYPRSPCGERPLTDDVSTGGKIISIHALLAESDSQHAPGTTSTT